jgi:hypothetical protein
VTLFQFMLGWLPDGSGRSIDFPGAGTAELATQPRGLADRRWKIGATGMLDAQVGRRANLEQCIAAAAGGARLREGPERGARSAAVV